ncbi:MULTISPECIES: LacI family DNA-binding transcriptional regulator [Arthrobacter]|uniref:LacI family transcriptional regulator n=1 Tax=Arthrobacter terricola TaxID=2547396 RepID=A0A4R5KAN3_9MICC|nr:MULTISPECIES: LacI family DNA-binding transcriptional regulator [Arthrobacter]MBT8163214.1 LacI family transcriptional regulator [Arthrobacter sp. GN70]TDF91528.1 LacI family transcriptional regulator [Arthrobacter terricola]
MTPLSPNASEPGVRRATITDVARLAGVGIKTVSRVLNDEPNVASATAERVRQAMAQLRWEPDLRARNLRRSDGRTHTIGLLVGSVTNPFAAQVNRAIEDAAAVRGSAVLTVSLDEDPEREIAAVAALTRRRVDGIALMPIAPSQAHLQAAMDHGLAVVCVDREPRGIAVDAVRSDSRTAATVATRHLLRRGHRRVGLLLDREDLWTAQQRRLGFLDALHAAGIDPTDCPILPGLRDAESSSMAAARLMRSDAPPTALFCGKNLITFGTVRALQHLGLQHRVALVGFDDFEFADLLDPGVTVVAQRPSQIGRLAAERLFARIERSDSRAPEAIDVPTDLIERGSGEIPPPAP